MYVCACVYVCMYVCACVHTCVCMCVCVCPCQVDLYFIVSVFSKKHAVGGHFSFSLLALTLLR